MKFPTDDPDRRTRIRLDFLIALMVVQIVLSIGLWVDRYRDRDEAQPAAAVKSDNPFDELYTEQPAESAQNTEPGVVELPAVEPVHEPIVPAKVKVQVLNGCGKTGIARRAQQWMERNDYEVRDVGNADRQDYRSSEVINRSGNATAARDLARMLGIDESKIKRKAAPPGLDVDLTLIIGADNKRLPFGR